MKQHFQASLVLVKFQKQDYFAYPESHNCKQLTAEIGLGNHSPRISYLLAYWLSRVL